MSNMSGADGKAGKEMKETKPPEPRFKIYGWVEGGVTFNGTSPADNQNFGHLFTDRANEPLLNQAVITFERTLDPKCTGFDWGFKAQFCMAAMGASSIRLVCSTSRRMSYSSPMSLRRI